MRFRSVICCAIFLIPAMLISAGAQAQRDVSVRIHNASDRVFDSVLVNFRGKEENYGRIPAGEVSNYRTVARAYSYAYIRVKFGEETAVFQPIDYVGESTLRPGRYTYRLTLQKRNSGEGYNLGLELVVDR